MDLKWANGVDLTPEAEDHLGKMAGKKKAKNGEAAPDSDGVVTTKIGRFGNKPQLSVRMTKADKSGWSFSYAHLYRISFTDQSTLVMEFSEHTVTITGRSLEKTLTYLEEHRAKEITESVERDEAIPDGAEVVESIAVVKKG
jgi:hypothetical protein